MSAPRPKTAPRKIPLWAWRMDAWIRSGKKGPRPRTAPKRLPPWFRVWRLWRLAKATRKGSAAWKAYHAAVAAQQDPDATASSHRAALVKWAKWGVAHNPEIHYTEGPARDDYLHGAKGHLPLSTDCSGFVTYCYWAAGLPDPSGLHYAYLGYTGTLLANAYKHGKVLTNLALARPGDLIVIGPGTGWHTTICIESGADPIVVSHGSEPGPLSEHQSYDSRLPKRVCQLLA